MGRADDLLIYLIALVVLTVIVAALLIWVVASGLKQRRDRKSTAAEVVAEPKPAPVSVPVVAETAEPAADQEVLRVLRDMSSGALYLEVEGRVYRSITEVHSPDVSRLVQQVAADMMRFARNVTPAVPATGPTPLPHPASAGTAGAVAKGPSLIQPHDVTPPAGTPTPGSLARRGEALINPGTPATPAPRLLGRAARLAAASETKKPTTGPLSAPEKKAGTGPLSATAKKSGTGPLSAPTRKPGTGPLSAATDTVDRVDLSLIKDNRPKVDIGSFWGRALSSPTTGSGIAGPRPLADELENVLKGLLNGLAKAPPFEIHFKTASDGSLLIDVDGVSFRGVDAIQDPAAKQLVQIVIRKWEAG